MDEVRAGRDPRQSVPKPASAATVAVQAETRQRLPFDDVQDFEDARRGFIGTLAEPTIRNAQGRPVWSLADYAFLEAQEPPATVNPSLWRIAQLNMNHGLFEVMPRVYQVRGFDISNMTVIEGETGIIVIDPLVSIETARAALDLYFTHRPARPIKAVIFSHSHVDHYGGVRGILDEADVRSGQTEVIAPNGFMEEVAAENVLAGTAMIRRAQFQFGPLLPRGPQGQVDAGLGKGLSRGTVTLIAPTRLITEPLQDLTVDGVRITFQLTPDTEAKVEMHMFFPDLRLLNVAENATHHLHNFLPFRGSQVRDPNFWAKCLNEALHRFAPEADALVAQHHWPTWGRERIRDFLTKQRDLYKFIHDQTVRHMNRGLTMQEIAEAVRLPEGLERTWHLRGYYGTVRHNTKAVYQRYLGWYDAHPASLDPLPPVERAAKSVAYMGGGSAVLAKARADFAAGDYRWVIDVLRDVIFADPANLDARALAADAMEQLGYQAESATWRNAYLQGARELRDGPPKLAARNAVSPDTVRALSLDLFFDYVAVRVDGSSAPAQPVVVNWHFNDLSETWSTTLSNGALTYMAGYADPTAVAEITLARTALNGLVLGEVTFGDLVTKGAARIEGDAAAVQAMFANLDAPRADFAILEP